jgi:hypothetical protein
VFPLTRTPKQYNADPKVPQRSSAPFPYQHLLIAIMADERSPLLQNGRENDDYSTVNEPEQTDSVAIHESTDAEQQLEQTVVAPQNSVITLVRFGNFRDSEILF